MTSAITSLLSALSADRRRELESVRDIILKNLPAGYEEVVSKGMLVYQVPLQHFSATYNGQPLWLAALGSTKSSLTLHLMPIYGSEQTAQRLKQAFQTLGKRPDMGKACIRYKNAADLPLDVIGEIIASMPVDRWVEIAQSARRK